MSEFDRGSVEEREADHPPAYTRRRFLQRSTMAVAGGVLFSCTGGKVIPQDREPHPVGRHGHTDQAGRVRDAREPQLQQRLRQVPRSDRDHRRRGGARGREAVDPMPRVAAERHPSRPSGASQLRERWQDGRVRQRRDRLQLRLLGLRRGPDPELLHMGARVRALRPLLRQRRWAFLPEPLLLHRRPVRRRDRQPREHRDEGHRRQGVQELGVRRARRRRLRLRQGRRRAT